MLPPPNLTGASLTSIKSGSPATTITFTGDYTLNSSLSLVIVSPTGVNGMPTTVLVGVTLEKGPASPLGLPKATATATIPAQAFRTTGKLTLFLHPYDKDQAGGLKLPLTEKPLPGQPARPPRFDLALKSQEVTIDVTS